MGREVELDATNIAHGGVCVARLDGRVVFVSDAIPGERVLARISDETKARFWRAETLRVLEPSPHRRPHVWPAADLSRDPRDRPGGADFGHIEPAHQRELKARVLAEALVRMASVDREVAVEPVPGPPDGTGWRTRERLHVGPDGTVGPYAARSHRVVPVADLPLAVPEVRAAAPLGERMPGPGEVLVLAPAGAPARVVAGSRPSPRTIRERVGDREFRVDDTGFWQVHRAAPAVLTEAVQAAIDPARFDPGAANLDLYGGVGLLAAAVADRFGAGTAITTVESDARASRHAAANLAGLPGASAVTARVERFVEGLADAAAADRARLAAGTVVLDPPRSGAGRRVVDGIAALKPAQVVYVACDPVAFARDVALFAAHGYRLDRLRAFDLFPSTHHVEAIGTLLRE